MRAKRTHDSRPVLDWARALLTEAKSLSGRDDHRGALALCNEVIERVGAEEGGALRERVAYASLLRGLSLGGLGRSAEEIGAYDDLVIRFGESQDPAVRRHVAWALNNKAIEFRDRGSIEAAVAAFEELVARFADVGDREVRRRVSWAIWHKTRLLNRLERSAECEPLFDQLAARHDEGLDAALDAHIAWSLEHRARELLQVGEPAAGIAVVEDLLQRFQNAASPRLQLRVLAAMRIRSKGLAALGRREEALAGYDDAVAAFGQTSDAEVLDSVAECVRRKAVLLDESGRVSRALATYDMALTLLAARDEPRLRERVIEVLLSKGITLGNAGHPAEAVVMYDSAVRTYLAIEGHENSAPDVLGMVVRALIYKVDRLCALDRFSEGCSVQNELRGVLGDARAPLTDDVGPDLELPPESDLAAELAELLSSDGLSWFAPNAPRPPVALMTERSLELYRLTQPWLAGDPDGWTGPLYAAVSVLREIADGYAMLTQASGPADRKALPLPASAATLHADVIRRFGVDEWAESLGFELADAEGGVTEGDGDSGDPVEDSADTSNPLAEEFARRFLAGAYNYDILEVLRKSRAGRDMLQSTYSLRAYAAQQLREARNWARWIAPRSPDLGGAATAWLLIAQGWFLAAHSQPDSVDVFPARAVLQHLLRDDAASEWLYEPGQAPLWTRTDDD